MRWGGVSRGGVRRGEVERGWVGRGGVGRGGVRGFRGKSHLRYLSHLM